MGFIKYSVVELGLEEDVPGWIKKSGAVEAVSTEPVVTDKSNDEPAANKRAEEHQEDNSKEK
jgi:hypothetical protein